MPALLVAIGLVSLATPFVEPKYYLRWFDFPGLLVAVPMPLFFGAAALTLWWSIGRGRDWMPFLFTLVIFALTRSEEHTSELQYLMRNSYAVFCLKKKIINNNATKI